VAAGQENKGREPLHAERLDFDGRGKVLPRERAVPLDGDADRAAEGRQGQHEQGDEKADDGPEKFFLFELEDRDGQEDEREKCKENGKENQRIREIHGFLRILMRCPSGFAPLYPTYHFLIFALHSLTTRVTLRLLVHSCGPASLKFVLPHAVVVFFVWRILNRPTAKHIAAALTKPTIIEVGNMLLKGEISLNGGCASVSNDRTI